MFWPGIKNILRRLNSQRQLYFLNHCFILWHMSNVVNHLWVIFTIVSLYCILIFSGFFCNKPKLPLTFSPGPNASDMKQPVYLGFERDVLRTVADYYQRLKEPLLTFHLYEVFVNILSECFTLGTHQNISHAHSVCTFPQRAVLYFSSSNCRPTAGAGRRHRGSSSQLPLAAATQPKTAPAFTAFHDPCLPEPPAAST